MEPPFIGHRRLDDIPVRKLIPLIDWTYFHWAWRTKADTDEGRRLRADAEAWLEGVADDPAYAMRAEQAFYPACGTDGSIEIEMHHDHHDGHDVSCPCCKGDIVVPTPRQQRAAPAECLALCDYVAPRSSDGRPCDYVGVFATTVSRHFVEEIEQLKRAGCDDYRTLLLQTVADRLAEAAAEYLHRQLGWQGIRPAVGYPSLPDLRQIFTLDSVVHLGRIGISLTENGAMYPQASVCGLYIQHPEAKYFEA